MKSYIALGFGNNYFYALGEDALPIPSHLLSDNDGESESIHTINPLVNILPLQEGTSPSFSGSNTLQEWLASLTSKYTSTTLPIIACGATHTTILSSSGQAQLMGTIFGLAHLKLSPQPNRLPLKITQLSSGRRHVLALTEGASQKGSGVLLSWGAGHFGQLGHGPELTSSLEPRIVERLLPNSCGGSIVDIAAGGLHSLAVVAMNNGHSKTIGDKVVRETKVFAWGSNRKSQCGVEGGKCATVPSPLPVVVIQREGRKGAEEKVDKVVQFEKVVAGRLHSVGLTAYGEVFTWGSTSMGRCGQTIVSNPRGGDRRICQEPRYVSALKNVVIESIAAGDAHTLALSKNGRVFAWGAGGDGQCGQGHIGNLFSPKRIREIYFENREKNGDQSESEQKLKANVKVESEVAMEEEILSHDLGAISNEKKIVKIRAAGYYSTVLSSQGDVYTWGYGGGPAMGHPIPAKQTDVPMLPLIEGNQYSYATSTKTYPEGYTEADNIRDCVSFDTELNVLMPRRVEVVMRLGLQAEDISVGPGHMVIICSMVGESNDNLAERSSEVINNITNGELDSPHLRDPPLNASVNTESGANTSITSTAEVVSNVSNESMDSSNNTKKGSRLLAKIKSSRSSREVAYPNDAKSPPGVGKEKKKSFRPVGKLIDAALHRNTGK